MTDEALLQLALRACVDREAQAVLGDAVIEAGWGDPRVTWLLGRRWHDGYVRSGTYPSCLVRTKTLRRAENLSRKNARNPTKRWCRAVAAVLLFGEWPEKAWAAWFDDEAYEARMPFYFQLDTAMPTTFLNLNREADPTRLAGMRLDMSLQTMLQRLRQVTDLRDARVISDEDAHRLIEAAMHGIEMSEDHRLPRRRA